MLAKPDFTDLPSVAIVVPCFNESKTLGATVRSLLALEYPPEKLQIIIVDDGSTDDTYAVARQFESDRVKVFRKANGGKHSAMNFALAQTQADLIGCLDADSVVAPDALLVIAPLFDNSKIAAVTPGILIKKPENMLQHMQEAEYRLGVFVRFTLAALGSAYITPGPFSILRTSVVRELGGWKHGHSTEDLEMALNIQDKGYLIGNAPKAIVYTGTPRTLPALFRQRVRWSYGFLRNGAEYRHMFANKRYGNLGLIILPMALLSIGITIFFSVHLLLSAISTVTHGILRLRIVGFDFNRASFSVFYLNTSALWFIIIASVAIVIGLISVGSYIGTGRRRPPIGTVLFVLFYSLVAPFWLTAAVVRAVFKTGVRWR
jgi:cellulose synthase/poly-beta-1,6-N-acetylglucosamine synthase-like glycosyltransferase